MRMFLESVAVIYVLFQPTEYKMLVFNSLPCNLENFNNGSRQGIVPILMKPISVIMMVKTKQHD